MIDDPTDGSTAVQPSPEGTPEGGQPVHGLRWGVKASFIQYVRGMPDGRAAVGDGAVPVGTDEIFFTLDPAAASAATWAFRGDLRFTGHYGMLFVRIARPWLVVEGGSATMTIEAGGGAREALVTTSLERVDLRAGTEIWVGADVRLAAAGVPLFNDVYAEGEPFEPLVLQVPVRDAVAEATQPRGPAQFAPGPREGADPGS